MSETNGSVKTIARLTHAENTQLSLWLIANKDKNKVEQPLLETVAARAEVVIGRRVDAKTIYRILRELKKLAPDACWDQKKAAGWAGGSYGGRLKACEDEIMEQGEQLRVVKAQLAQHQAALHLLAKRAGLSLPTDLGFVPVEKPLAVAAK